MLSGDGLDFGPAVHGDSPRGRRGHRTNGSTSLPPSTGSVPASGMCCDFLVQGYDTAGLADRLGISPHTVRDHLKNVFRKTSNRSRSELLSALAGAGKPYPITRRSQMCHPQHVLQWD